MDGNGRWAAARGLVRSEGHSEGVRTVSRIVEAAPGLGIGVLTLFAFSSDNWRRPRGEVERLMAMLAHYMDSETPRCLRNGVRLSAIGRRDRLDPELACAIERAEAATAACNRLWLRIAIDYSGRDAILAAARGLLDVSRESLDHALGPQVDLVIRTGGERRLSDFLLWECAYAELVFSRRMWPDFDAADLAGAMDEFHRRERRFGAAQPQPQRVAAGWLD
jgi:undecaprenyl diphosphate synthase